MIKLPESLRVHLEHICIESRTPAFILVSRSGVLLDWGGPCGEYGFMSLEKDVPISDQAEVLEGLLPLGGIAVSLPHVNLAGDTSADIHCFPGDEGDWVVFLESTGTAEEQRAFQQNMNELALLRDEQEKLIARIQQDHGNLLTILDQLHVVTVLIDAEGNVEFINRAGRELLVKTQADVLGVPWGRAFPFSDADRATLQEQLDLPQGSRKTTNVYMDAAGSRHYWMEVEVEDDPAAPDKRLLYMYDLSDVFDLRALLNENSEFQGIVGKSKPMARIFQMIQDLSKLDATVLIEGETGTGKELVARAIHAASSRKNNPLVVVNSAGLSDSLINSELFGHRKGAFTGATQDQEGLFEAAHGGTILLDEIGDIPMNTQTRILRVLEEREVIRIGETRARKIDIRILAATNKDLGEEVKKGNFREDLLYRIRIARVSLPPLRNRREDIPVLAEAFLRKSSVATGKAVEGIDSAAMRLLMSYAWPGNVRELRNAVDFALIACRGPVIQVSHLPPEITALPAGPEPSRPYEVVSEKDRILKALEETGGHRGKAASLLGISRATLYRRMKACF
ncbi:MAG: sigma 54-interacting transcriptional regulator [Kiritimatiellia bacterium]|nr:sigma 54-interacting transcriptional regulator [Kiritimatiellia bacterium]